jgi:hypothetical protein
MGRGIGPATFDWSEWAKHFFYAHGGLLKEEDGTFVTTDSLLQAYDRLQEALQRKR